MQLYTIGHSTHSIEFFLDLLKTFGITLLIDVRAFPQSKRMPWFGKHSLIDTLTQHQISYQHMPALGGMRKPKPETINLGLRNASFRGYADYMQSPLFDAALDSLNKSLDTNACVAIMCAEANPFHCHRILISDAEIVRGIEVKHIMSNKDVQLHKLTKFAVYEKNSSPPKVFYPKSKA